MTARWATGTRPMSDIRRREFMILLGGAAAWPLAARAQQPDRVRRVGVLMGIADDPEGQARVMVFKQALHALGWTEGRNVQFIYRWSAGRSGIPPARRPRYLCKLATQSPPAWSKAWRDPGAISPVSRI